MESTMKAAVVREFGKPLVMEEVAVPRPGAGQILVKIAATGVCHTDAYTLGGSDPEGVFPVVLGHEGAGIVARSGHYLGEFQREIGRGEGEVAGTQGVPRRALPCRQRIDPDDVRTVKRAHVRPPFLAAATPCNSRA